MCEWVRGSAAHELCQTTEQEGSERAIQRALSDYLFHNFTLGAGLLFFPLQPMELRFSDSTD